MFLAHSPVFEGCTVFYAVALPCLRAAPAPTAVRYPEVLTSFCAKAFPPMFYQNRLAGSMHLPHGAQVWASWLLLVESGGLSDDCSRPERPVRDLIGWGMVHRA